MLRLLPPCTGLHSWDERPAPAAFQWTAPPTFQDDGDDELGNLTNDDGGEWLSGDEHRERGNHAPG